MSVVGNWRRELERFAPDLSVHIHHGAASGWPRTTLATALAPTTDVVLTTYGLRHPRSRDALAGIAWRRIVLDEAQNIKNSGAAPVAGGPRG